MWDTFLPVARGILENSVCTRGTARKLLPLLLLLLLLDEILSHLSLSLSLSYLYHSSKFCQMDWVMFPMVGFANCTTLVFVLLLSLFRIVNYLLPTSTALLKNRCIIHFSFDYNIIIKILNCYYVSLYYGVWNPSVGKWLLVFWFSIWYNAQAQARALKTANRL